MATSTMGSAGTQKEISTNPTYWLILVALVILIVVGYSTRTANRDTLTPSSESTKTNDFRMDRPLDNMSTNPMNNFGLPWEQNNKNNLNRINENGPLSPNAPTEPGTRN